MAAAAKTVFRVRQVSGHDMAIVVEVKDGDTGLGSGPPREIRNGQIHLGGVDSFWLVTGVKKEPKFAARHQEAPVGLFATTTSPLAMRIKGSSQFEFSSRLQGLPGTGALDAVSVATASRLSVGFSPHDMSHEEIVTQLRQGRLFIPTRCKVDAIEVRMNIWMTSGFIRHPNELYGLSPQTSIRSAPTVATDAKPSWVRLGDGLVVFNPQPRWSPPVHMDMRSDDEILKSAEEWLSRTAIAASGEAGLSQANLSELMRARISGTVGDQEKEDLAAALRLISSRPSLLDAIPQMMARDPKWQVRILTFEQTEQERLREEIRQRLVAEAEEQEFRFVELRALVADAEQRLATTAHREILLRNASEQHEKALREKIEEAARGIGRNVSESARQLREEFEQLRTEIRKVEQMISTVTREAPSREEVSVTSAIYAPPPVAPTAGAQDILRTIQELAKASGLTPSELMAIVLYSTEEVPVLVGETAAASAADIAYAIGGDDAAVVFCDPTHVSLQDIMRDEAGGMAKAIENARSRSDILVPVALCGITSGPCEYWLPQLAEMRRIGRLPMNLAFVASAGVDGLRVSVPNSVLRYLFPIQVSQAKKPGRVVRFAGHWALLQDGGNERKEEAVELLTAADVDAAFLVRGTKMLSRVPVGPELKLADVAAVLLRQQMWTKTPGDAFDHELNRFFQNLGG